VGSGSPRANRSAVDRCFLETGSPPVSASGGASACTDAEQPEFDGRQAFYSGGFLEEGEPFRVKLSPDIRAGTYAFMCLVHRASMVGALEVRAPGVERPRVADVRKLGMDEENEVASTLEPAARRAAARRTAGSVLAGTGPVGRSRGLLSSFIPDVLTIRAGDPVTWRLYGMHSISFDAPRDAQEGVLIEERDGVRINLDAWRPVESAPPPAAAVSFPPTAADVDVDGGVWSGEGSFSSGVLRATAPAEVTYKLTFANAGAYRYQCLVHSRMRGRVVVE
jgi:plastocyanin